MDLHDWANILTSLMDFTQLQLKLKDFCFWVFTLKCLMIISQQLWSWKRILKYLQINYFHSFYNFCTGYSQNSFVSIFVFSPAWRLMVWSFHTVCTSKLLYLTSTESELRIVKNWDFLLTVSNIKYCRHIKSMCDRQNFWL